jgi:hypothetical protein
MASQIPPETVARITVAIVATALPNSINLKLDNDVRARSPADAIT